MPQFSQVSLHKTPRFIGQVSWSPEAQALKCRGQILATEGWCLTQVTPGETEWLGEEAYNCA